jgi:hypothetical protein
MSDNTLLILATVATVFGTVGGALEKLCSPESFWYRLGVILASLGVDLTSLGKLSIGVASADATRVQVNAASLTMGKLDAVRKDASKIAPLGVLMLLLSGCISSAPIVPVTPANTAQVSSCQSSAAVHNDVVIGGFVLGGISAGLGSAGAAVSDSNAKTDLAISAAVVGGLMLVDSAIAGFSASNFANSQCSGVVGALPVIAKPAPSPVAP